MAPRTTSGVSSCDLKSTVSNRHSSTPHAAGTPVQRSFRGVVRESYEEEGSLIVAATVEDLDSTGLTDREIEERTGVGAAQLSRIRSGQAHPPGSLTAWAIDNSRHNPPRTLVAICSVGEGTFTPKPPPNVEEWHAAYREVLSEMDILDRVQEKAARKLGMVKP
jgi:transcriptional regulator with XRE-family HTH domain